MGRGTPVNGYLSGEGFLLELPEALDLKAYQSKLTEIMEAINTTPHGQEHDAQYEALVGDVIKYCFFRQLTNVKPHVRTIDGKVIRDWIASNVANTGFWFSMKEAYGARQVMWECKNYATLAAKDFHQTAYYMNNTIGRLVILCFRGEVKGSYIGHIRRISTDRDGMVIMLSDKDLRTFVRQAMKGAVKDSHIQGLYDDIVRRSS